MILYEKLNGSPHDIILRYCCELFMKEGFAKISIESISKKLHISKKTFYKYYSSKEHLVDEIADLITQTMQSRMVEIIESKKNSVEKFVAILQLFAEVIPKFGELWLNDLRFHLPHIWIKIDNFRTKNIYLNMSKIIDQGVKEGFIKPYRKEITTAIIISSIRTVINPDFIMSNNISVQQAAFSIFEIILNGIFTTKGKFIYNKLKPKVFYEKTF